MKKRGFTLVELLAIILILAIIALITVPMIITLIRNARKSVFKSNAEQVLSASKMYYSKNITDDGVIIEIRENQVNKLQYMNDTTNSEALPGFHMKGKLPQKGKITITDDGKIAFDLYNGDFCAYKTEEANTIYILEGDNCDKNVKIPKIEGTVATKDKDKLVVVASGFYEEDNVRTPAKIVRYGFKIDNGDWKYTTNDYYMFSGLKSGSTHNIKISCTNEVGITIEKDLGNKTVSNLDTTVISAPTGWAKSKTVTITYPKGRYKYQYSLDEGVTWLSDGITNGVKTLPYSSQNDNGKYVMARVLDKAGNVEEARVLKIAGIDTTLPTCGEISGAGDANHWTKNNRTVSVECSDSWGECSNTSFSNTFSSNATTGTIQISDKAGNKSDCPVGVYVDKSKPTCGTISGAGDANHWTKDNRTISVACSDTGGSTCSQATFSNTFSSNTATGTIQISDKAGNTEDCPVGAYVDKTAPTCTTSGGRDTWGNTGLTLTGTCSDQGGSGCSNISRTITGSNVEIAKVEYEAHEQDLGWMGFVANGDVGGITGHNKRLEAIKIRVSTPGYSCGVQYLPHIANFGWDDSWTANGAEAGTTGQSKSIEAIQIKLTGDCANVFNIKYRAHVQNVGWENWVSNGAEAGTTGEAKNLEAIQIYLEPKTEDEYKLINYTPVRKISAGTVTDGAGNSANCSKTLALIDDDGPTLQSITNTSGNGTLTCGEVGVGVTALDSKSGVQKYQISSNNSTWTDVNSLDNTPHTAKQNNTIYYRACDYAGKCGPSASTTVHIGIFTPTSSTTCNTQNCGTSRPCTKTRKVYKTASMSYTNMSQIKKCPYTYMNVDTLVSISACCDAKYGLGGGHAFGAEAYCTSADGGHCYCKYAVEESYQTTCYSNAACDSCTTEEGGATCHD